MPESPIHRAQVGAALGALALPTESAEPLFTHLGAHMVGGPFFGVDGAMDHLWVGVEVPMGAAADVRTLLVALEVDAPVADAMLAGVQAFGGQLDVAVRVGGLTPGVRLVARQAEDTRGALAALRATGIGEEAASAWEDLRARLRTSDGHRALAATLRSTLELPRYSTVARPRFLKDSTDDLVLRLQAAAEVLGTAKAQVDWAANMARALCVRPVNDVGIEAVVGSAGLTRELSIHYHQIPSRFALKIAALLGHSGELGARAGALSGVVALPEDVVTRLVLTTGPAGPASRWTLEARGPR